MEMRLRGVVSEHLHSTSLAARLSQTTRTSFSSVSTPSQCTLLLSASPLVGLLTALVVVEAEEEGLVVVALTGLWFSPSLSSEESKAAPVPKADERKDDK
jgi:hypothetical protein